MARLLALVVFAGAAVAESARNDLSLREHPIEGVISMLNDLAATAKEEGKAENLEYEKYASWCKDSKATLNEAIATEKSTIESLSDEIDGLKSTIETTTADIDYLVKQIEAQESAAAKAKAERESKHEVYEEEQENYEETIEAVDTALDGLKKAEEKASSASSASLLQEVRHADLLSEFRMPEQGRRAMKAFLASPALLQVKDPHAQKAVETFQEMDEDFKVDKLASTEDETHAKNEYNLAKAAREEAISAAKSARDEKDQFKSDSEARKSDAEKEKKDQEDALAADSTSLDDTTKSCAASAQNFAERSAMRKGELESMEMAVKILTKVTHVRNPDEHEIPAKEGLLEEHFGIADVLAFVQEGKRHHGHKHHHGHHHAKKVAHTVAASVVALLRQAANESHAVHVAAMNQLASELAVYEGPFDEVKAMIQKMIFHLMDEQTDEDKHKNWCDVETETSTESKEDKDTKIKGFTKKMDEMDKTIAELTKDISENAEKVATLNTYVKEETELRQKNHEEIEATIKDSADASAAIEQAVAVLTKFYKDSGMMTKEPWEFLQTSAARDVELPDAPSAWDSSYTGVSDPNQGDNAVLALLDKVGTKFKDMEAAAKVQDLEDQNNYDADMQAKKIELSETEMDTTMKTEKKGSLEDKLDGMREATKHTEVELGAVTSYLKDLEPACGEGDSTYDDRKKARADEIAALRKAQTILEEAFRNEKAES